MNGELFDLWRGFGGRPQIAKNVENGTYLPHMVYAEGTKLHFEDREHSLGEFTTLFFNTLL